MHRAIAAADVLAPTVVGAILGGRALTIGFPSARQRRLCDGKACAFVGHHGSAMAAPRATIESAVQIERYSPELGRLELR